MNISVKDAYRISIWYRDCHTSLIDEYDKNVYKQIISVLKGCMEKMDDENENSITYNDCYEYLDYLLKKEG